MSKKIITICILISLVFAFGQGQAVKAQNKKQQALNAYKILLASEYEISRYVTGEDIQFALIDLNQDGVQEMIVTGDFSYHSSILAYVNGGIQSVGSGFAGVIKWYPNKHLIYSTTCHSGNDDYFYYKYEGNKMKEVACKHGSDGVNAVTGKRKKVANGFAPYLYTLNGKKTSKSRYQKTVKALLSGAKEKKIKWYKNTSENRKHYLK